MEWGPPTCYRNQAFFLRGARVGRGRRGPFKICWTAGPGGGWGSKIHSQEFWGERKPRQQRRDLATSSTLTLTTRSSSVCPWMDPLTSLSFQLLVCKTKFTGSSTKLPLVTTCWFYNSNQYQISLDIKFTVLIQSNQTAGNSVIGKSHIPRVAIVTRSPAEWVLDIKTSDNNVLCYYTQVKD